MTNKIIYIANLRLPTEKGYGIQIAKMCEVFAAAGLTVKLLFPFRRNNITDDFFDYYDVNETFMLKKVWAPDFYLPGSFDKFAFFLKSFISAVILVVKALAEGDKCFYSRDELIIYLLSFFRRNVFFEAHKYSSSKKWFYRRFKRVGIKIIVISDGLKKVFSGDGFDAGSIIVAPDGVDLDKINLNISKEESRKLLALPMDSKIILYTGHLFGWKGVETLAKAAEYLPEYKFVFVGGTENDIQKFRNANKERKNIDIIGHRPHSEIPKYLKAADILALPNSSREALSANYTSPLKMFEYMASGRPIIASDPPSIREILNDSNAVLFKPDDPEALAKAIKKISSDEKLAERLADKALSDVKNYTWAKRAENITKFIYFHTHV